MSLMFLENNTELLKIEPCEFRRVYTLDESLELKYSHSDIVVLLENGERGMIEIVQGMLNNGSYVIKTKPTDTTFDIRLTKSGSNCINWLKRIVFMTFPDLPTTDVYCLEVIRPSSISD